MNFTQEQIEEKAKELKRAYNRKNYLENREKRREAQKRHWQKKALEALLSETTENKP